MKTSPRDELIYEETHRGMRDKSNLPRSLGRRPANDFRIPQLPLEWLDAGAWRLPSGKALAEFALQAGFLAPLLFNTERFAGRRSSQPVLGNVLADPTKPLGKEGRR